MEYYLDVSEESDDEICFDEVTFEKFLKLVNCNTAANTKYEVSSKGNHNKIVDGNNIGSDLDKLISKLNSCIKTVLVDCNKVEMGENFCMTDSQEEKLCISPTNSKYNENLSSISECTKYNELKCEDDTHYKNIKLNLSEETESCNTTMFKSTPDKKIKNIDTNFNTPLMESKPKISDIQTLSILNTTPHFDESDSITEEKEKKCDSLQDSDSSDELNDTLELIERIFNDKYNDHDEEYTPEKELNLPLPLESFSNPELHPIPILNIKKCDPTFEATSLGWHIVNTDKSVCLVDKRGKNISDSRGNAGFIETDDMLKSVEHVLTKSGTCISVYKYSFLNMDKKDFKCTTNLLNDSPRASNYKIFMSLSTKKTSLKTETKKNEYYYTSSSLAAYLKNVSQVASLEDVKEATT